MEITPIFNAAAAGPNTDGAATDAPTPQGPTPSGPAAAEFSSAASAPEPAVAAAQAELETLEEGRPAPAPRHNLNPPTRVMKASHSDVELQREARIRALKAYVQFHQKKPAHDANHDQGEDLELNW